MRDIKFRGLTAEGVWVFGNLIYGKRFTRIDKCPVIKESVGEFTGLRDRNNNEIYEGDIVRYYDDVKNRYIYFHVIYHRGCFALVKGFNTHPQSITYLSYEMEIVGNVHTSPELLNDDK